MDLRTYLKDLEAYESMAPVEIQEKHDIHLEVCAFIHHLEKQKQYPLLRFSNIDNLSRERSEFPLLMNTFATREA